MLVLQHWEPSAPFNADADVNADSNSDALQPWDTSFVVDVDADADFDAFQPKFVKKRAPFVVDSDANSDSDALQPWKSGLFLCWQVLHKLWHSFCRYNTLIVLKYMKKLFILHIWVSYILVIVNLTLI